MDARRRNKMQLHLVASASVPSAGDQAAFGPELVKMLHARLRFSSQVGGVLSRVRLAVLRSQTGLEVVRQGETPETPRVGEHCRQNPQLWPLLVKS